MRKKINTKKRTVKKKIAKQKKYPGAAQWGDAFEKLARRRPLKFNFIRPSSGISGDPFDIRGNEEHVTDALHYAQAPSKIPSAVLLNTRGELGTAPAHYSKGKYTPWEVIDDWKLDYYTGNALKYVCRHKHKGKPVEDIQKAIDCLIKYKGILEDYEHKHKDIAALENELRK